jgi:hypothetical protein
MRLDLEYPVIALDRGEVLTLDEAVGKRILAQRGTVWITEEDNVDDHILGAGETLTVTHGGRTVIQALNPAWISIRESAGSAIAWN